MLELNLGLKCYSGYSFPLIQESQIKVNSFSFVSPGTLMIRTHPSQSWSEGSPVLHKQAVTSIIIIIIGYYWFNWVRKNVFIQKIRIRSEFFCAEKGGLSQTFPGSESASEEVLGCFLPVVIQRWTWSDIRKVKNTPLHPTIYKALRTWQSFL